MTHSYTKGQWPISYTEVITQVYKTKCVNTKKLHS